MWYVIGAVWIAVLVAIVWSYSRKRSRRESERQRRFSDLLSEAKVAAAGAGEAAAPAMVPSPAAAPAAPPAPEPATPPFARKSRLLGQADALLYYVVRAGLPDHEVFAWLTLADIVELAPGQAGYDAVQRLRRLTQQRVDFVVCNRKLEIVAAIVIDRAGPTDAAQIEGRRLIEESLRTAGVRLVRIDAAAPPRHLQVRALVYGEENKS